MSKYGSENVSIEFRDLQATTMSLSRNGQFALLAGRKYLTAISIEAKPGEVVVRIPFGGKYEISNTQWSHLSNSSVVAVASSQRCDVFELTDGAELKCLYRLKCHTRVITDLDWCTLTPSLLATSSFDSFVHIWDVRCPRDPGSEKPQLSLSALDGASQVRWNKWKLESLASCDGGHVKIWDMRRPNSPAEYIAAHASKINGLEWITKDVVVTAAQDCTVKFNRIAVITPAKAKGPCLTLSTPVWRARPSPFGRGIVTQCVPILRRDSGLLSLWDWKRFSSPIFTFQAHDIVEFGWKTSSNCELLSWSRDQTLRIWSLPREVIELCGEDMWPPNRKISEMSPSIDDDTSLDEFDINPDVPTKISPKKEGSVERKSRKAVSQLTKRDQILQDEFETVAETMPDNVNFEQQEVERGLLRFSWKPDPKGRFVLCVILASFPLAYPSASPTFLITSAANEVDKSQLLKILKHTAQQGTRKSEPCLNSCINQFAAFMSPIKPLDEPSSLFRFPSRGVSNIPFPRTSGARFCFVGVLVCFGRPPYLRRVKSSEAGTPRSLSALGPFLSQLAHDDKSLKSRRSRRGEKKRAGVVTLVDVSMLLPFNKEVASNYKHISKWHLRKTACSDNSQVAASCKKLSVAHAWQAASVVSDFSAVTTTSPFGSGPHELAMINVCDSYDDDEDINWITYHPLGSDLVQSMITHYAHEGDVQTAAALACHFTVFDESSCARGSFQEYNYNHHCVPSPVDPTTIPPFHCKSTQQSKQPRLTLPKWWTKGLGSPYHTVHGSGSTTGSDTLHGVVVNPLSDNFFRPYRSNSWSDSLDDNKLLGVINGATGGKFGTDRGVILDPSFHRVFDSYKKSYAEILYRWGFLQQRAEVVKCLTVAAESSFLMRSGVDYVIMCKTCKQRVRGPQCQSCKKVVSICAICDIPAKGLCTYCSTCGHGGHSQHMIQWFKVSQNCPTGCGCCCIQEHNRT